MTHKHTTDISDDKGKEVMPATMRGDVMSCSVVRSDVLGMISCGFTSLVLHNVNK